MSSIYRKAVCALIALLFVSPLSACNKATPTLTVPASMLLCKPAPEPQAETDNQLAAYILALDEAGADCRDKLSAVKDLLDE